MKKLSKGKTKIIRVIWKVFALQKIQLFESYCLLQLPFERIIMSDQTIIWFVLKLGLPIYRGGWPRYNCLDNILNPRASLPPSAVTRDPFWYDLGDVGLRPFRATSCLPPFLRDSYLSPIKRRYLWTKHPMVSNETINQNFEFVSNILILWFNFLF